MAAGEVNGWAVLARDSAQPDGSIELAGSFTAERLEAITPQSAQKDAKTRLQEWLQGRGSPLPEYTLLREEGADHVKKFYVQCTITDDGSMVEASGSSRRRAEQAAAAKMMELLQEAFAA